MTGPVRQTMYTHGYSDSVLASHRQRTAENSAGYLLPHLNKSMHLLDVGSGAATITTGFVPLVASVTALELKKEALDLTRQEAQRNGVEMDFALGDVHALPFADNTFDAVHVHQVLQHVADPILALKEMRRVVKPGGVVAARESDYEVFAWFPEDPLLSEWRQLYLDISRSNGGHPDAGRRLLYWAMVAGFTDIEPSAMSWCFATQPTRDYWGGMWERRILDSSIAEQARSRGVSQQKLEDISQAWARWKDTPYGWFMVPHAAILAYK